MEYDYERRNSNKYSSESPTSSSVSSSSNLSTKYQVGIPSKANFEHDDQALSSSTSQIFATAAAFHLSQNDAVFYSRETMHLLAKFLSAHSNNQIFRSLYAFAPDNLAWLWAFLDWNAPIDLNKIPSQEKYEPFSFINNNSNISLNETHAEMINRILFDAPLIQYKYRENIMIGDVFKFIEYVQNIKVPQVAKALFLLYFPRFSIYFQNTLDNVMKPKLLRANIHLIKKVDDMVVSLIKSRYTNLDEYKDKILKGNNLPSYIKTLLKENNFWEQTNLEINQDTYYNINYQNVEVFNASNENTEDLVFNTNNLFNMLNLNKQPTFEKTAIDEHVTIFGDFDETNLDQPEFTTNFLPSDTAATAFKKTIDYMKQLSESNKINDDLDHDGFEKGRFMGNLNLGNKELFDETYEVFDDRFNNDEYDVSGACSPYIVRSIDSFRQASSMRRQNDKSAEIKNLLYKKIPGCEYSDQLNIDNFQQAIHTNINGTPVKPEFNRFNNNNNQHVSSPQKYNIPPLQIYTPKTPSNLSEFSYGQDKQNTSVWSNETSLNKTNSAKKSNLSTLNQYGTGSTPVTPPPSAKLKTTPVSISTVVCNNNSGINLECIGSPNMIKNGNLSPPSFFKPSHFTPNALKINEQFFNNSPMTQNEQYNSLYKHTFYGSPVTRVTNSTFNKSLQYNNKNDYASFSGLKQHHRFFNSNNELPSVGCFSPKTSTLIADGTTYYGSNGNINYKNEPAHEEINNDCRENNFNKLNIANNNRIMNYSKNYQQHTWSGRLPPKTYVDCGIYSRKVFLGGLPWDVNQHHLQSLLQKYGTVRLEVPGKDSKHPRVSAISKTPERSTPGYLYIIFDHESSVQRMLAECRKEYKNGGEHYFFTIVVPPQNNNYTHNNNGYMSPNMNSKRCGKAKEVEVIPWNQEDTSYVPINKSCSLPSKIDAKSTIFVGALHGMLNAHGLSKVMNEIFGEVIHASLDTDKYKYPIGSGRVTFRNRSSYIKAINAKFVTIKANLDPSDPSPKFEKTIQIDPYLEEAKCCRCNNRSIYFCRNENCLDYFCESCWNIPTKHDMNINGEHQSLSRMQNSKTNFN